MTGIVWTLVAVSAAAAVAASIDCARSRRPGWASVIGYAAMGLLSVAMLIAVIWDLSTGRANVGWGLGAGYGAATLLVVPVAFMWGIGDHSRWGPGVLAIGALAIAALALRVGDMWGVL